MTKQPLKADVEVVDLQAGSVKAVDDGKDDAFDAADMAARKDHNMDVLLRLFSQSLKRQEA